MPASRIAVLHGYGFIGHSPTHVDLDVMTSAVCEAVLRRHAAYDLIVIPAGWHDATLPARPTNAELMARWLTERDVPERKIVTQFTCGCFQYEPPQDTIMEADLTGLIFQKLFSPLCPRDIPFDAFGAFFHIPRIRAIWEYRTRNCRNTIGAFSTGMLRLRYWARALQEPPGFIMNCFDPLGTGWFFKALRAGRIHRGHKKFVPLTSAAWFPKLA